MIEGFSADAYRDCYKPWKFRRKKRRRRELSPVQAAIFYAAKAMIEDGRSVEEAVRWAAGEVKSEKLRVKSET